MRVAEKWAGRVPGVGHRPGHVEGARAAGRGGARRGAPDRPHQRARSEARIRELERALAETTGSISWRITAPLRRLGSRR